MQKLQKMFDTVLFALREQGVRSANTNGRCLYRGPNSTKCAIGHLIPDELYDPEMETGGVFVAAHQHPALAVLWECDPVIMSTDGSWEDPTLIFLDKLQAIHDTNMPTTADIAQVSIAEWERRMIGLATIHGLIYTPPVAE